MNVESLYGGSAADTITYGAAISKGFADLGDGADTLNLAAGANVITVANIETVNGNTGTDAVTLSAELTSASSIDLGGRARIAWRSATSTTPARSRTSRHRPAARASDTITYATIAHRRLDQPRRRRRHPEARRLRQHRDGFGVESLIGGSAADVITLGQHGQQRSRSRASRPSTGGAAADTVTLTAALSGSVKVDLAGGNDALYLADVANTGSASNVESLYGGSANDTITYGAVISKGLRQPWRRQRYAHPWPTAITSRRFRTSRR